MCRATKLRRFKGYYGSDPLALSKIWEDLQTTAIEEARIDQKHAKQFDLFLLSMFFLKGYGTNEHEAGFIGLTEKTVRKHHWCYAQKISALKAQKIVFPEEWSNDDTPIFLYSVDGIHCRIYEPKHATESKNPKFYSHKFKQAALNYELALDLWESRLVWMNGPQPAGTHDITVFRSKLLGKTPAGKKGIGDDFERLSKPCHLREVADAKEFTPIEVIEVGCDNLNYKCIHLCVHCTPPR